MTHAQQDLERRVRKIVLDHLEMCHIDETTSQAYLKRVADAIVVALHDEVNIVAK